MARHEPDGHGSNVTLKGKRWMSDAESQQVQNALGLMGYVSAHAMNEPIRRMANDLSQFIQLVTTPRNPRPLINIHTDATIAFDNFLNQIPLFRKRVLRNMSLFVGETESAQVEAALQLEFDQVSPWRVLWEVRNSTQHAMLPTDLVEVQSKTGSDGNRVIQWDLLVEKWRSLHSGFPPILNSLPPRLDFWELITRSLTFCDDTVGRCFLLAADRLDAAATLVLELFGVALADARPGQELGVTIVRFVGQGSHRQLVQQHPLNHIQCGEVLLNTDQARERAGLPRVRPAPPEA
jgi:hypothetical protein